MADPTYVETWSERCKVSFAGETVKTEMAFEALTETVDIDLADKDIEAIATTSGGRLVKYTPQDITTVTIEAYPLEAGSVTGSTGYGFFDMMNTVDATQPVVVSIDHQRTRYRICVLWTNDTANTGAWKGVVSGKKALRFVGCGFITGAKPSFTDGVLKWTVTMKIPPFKKDYTKPNMKIESCDATATLAAVSTFSATVNFTVTN